MTLADDLRHLPTLAYQSAQRTIEATYGGSDGSGVRTAPGSKPPAGVDLDRVDLDRGRQWPHLLARLGQCVRVVCEECPSVLDAGPELCVEGAETWAGECQWLLATMATWERDDWTREWIGTEVAAITRKLRHKVERRPRENATDGLVARRCAVCGGTIEAYTSETVAVAECRACDRVIAMRERVRVTTAEAAVRLGITPDGVRMRVMRGKLTREADGLIVGAELDWARAKLGLPTASGDG